MKEEIKNNVEFQLFDDKIENLHPKVINSNEDDAWAVIKEKTLNWPASYIHSFYTSFYSFLDDNEFETIMENLKSKNSKYLDGYIDFFKHTQQKLQFDLNSRMVGDISRNLNKIPTDTYYQYLMGLISKQKLTSPQIYDQALISKDYFSKIITGRNNKRKFIPRKELLLKIAFVMKLTLDETYVLLNKAGHTFVDCDRADYIYVYFLNKKIYDTAELEDILSFFELPALFEFPS